MEYCVYILECSNGAYYTGYTNNLTRRFKEHLTGSAKCKYTRAFPPVKLLASWPVGAKLSIALKLEKKIKSLTRKQKTQLINCPDLISEYCTEVIEGVIHTG